MLLSRTVEVVEAEGVGFRRGCCLCVGEVAGLSPVAQLSPTGRVTGTGHSAV